jgi:hypothetical protein
VIVNLDPRELSDVVKQKIMEGERKVALANDLYYKPIKKYCAMKIWQEVSNERISVLQSCNHELVILRK